MNVSSPGNPRAATRRPLRIALMANGAVRPRSIYGFVQWANAQNDIDVVCLILHPPGHTTSLSSALSDAALFLVTRVEHANLKNDKHLADEMRAFDLSRLVVNKIEIRPVISSSDRACRFDDVDVQKVRALALDLLVSFDDTVYGGELLNAAGLGIVSLRYGNGHVRHASPAGFWEVYLRQPTTEFSIRRLAENHRGDEVLMRGRLPTRHYYLLNQAALFRKSTHYLKAVVRKIARTGNIPLPLGAAKVSGASAPRRPRMRDIAVYFCKYAYSILTKKVRRLLNIDYRWNVAFVPQEWRHANFSRSLPITSRPGHYLADPFVISRDGRDYCFVEAFDRSKSRGTIESYELTSTGAIRIGVAVEETFHLSFPFLLNYRGELYMCPESSENNDIRIYKCVQFPLQWKLEKIVMKNLHAVDTMLFEEGGKWWMLTNTDPAGIGDFSELSIFSANSPLDDNWAPHSENPILVDASHARNAGLLLDGHRYFRCAQGRGFDRYGESISINEIVEISNATYVETSISTIAATFGHGAIATHHMHSNGKITVFDYLTSARTDAYSTNHSFRIAQSATRDTVFHSTYDDRSLAR